MKKLLLATSALAFAGQAFAADLPMSMPVKAPVVAAVPYSWTSCYVGGHGGAGWDRTRFSDSSVGGVVPVGSSVGVNSRAGGLGSVQAGCDYQFANRWVIGLAGDFSWANIPGAATDPFFAGKAGAPITMNTQTDRLATITGRIGYALDNVLLYGKGGAAFAHDRYSIQNLRGLITGTPCSVGGTDVACNPTASTNRTGWTIGAGFEWAFARNWSAFLEYDHYGFDKKALSFTDPNTTGVAVLNVAQNIDVIKAGINFRLSP